MKAEKLQIQIRDLKYFIDGKVEPIPMTADGSVMALVGRQVKPAGHKAIHAFLFPKAMYTPEQAEKFVEEHRKESEARARREEKFVTFKIADANDSDASFWATASIESPDRVGDVIHADGWDLTNFKKNPVIQPFHDYQALPVAKAADIYVRDKELRFKPKFAVDIPKYDLPGIMYGLYKGGYMSAFSVGFDPKKWAFVDKDNFWSGIEYFEQELLEISAVPVPCHPGALIDPAYQRMMKSYFLGGIMRREEPAAGQEPAPQAPAAGDPAAGTPAADPAQDPAPAPTEDPAATPDSAQEGPGATPGGGDTPAESPKPAQEPAAAPSPAPVATPDTPPAAPQDPPAPAAEPPAEPGKAVIMPILNLKNADELYEIASIIRSGKVISERNRARIKGTIAELNRTAAALQTLLKLTEAKSKDQDPDARDESPRVAALLQDFKALRQK